MKSIIRVALCGLVAIFLMTSCDMLGIKDKEPVRETISVSLRNEIVQKQSGAVFVTVACSSDWTLSLNFQDSESWAKLSHSSGRGYKSNISLSYDENKGKAQRQVTLILSSEGQTKSVILTQESGAAVASNDFIVDNTTCGWLELPQTNANDGMDFGCHYFTVNGRNKRNYSFYYSYKDYVSVWVAYPLNSGLIGSGSRPNPAPWNYDPLIPEKKQMNIIDGGFGRQGYDRGHQLPSADRYSGNSNMHTYYATNLTPQRSSFNQGLWLNVENLSRDWAKNSIVDTLYVVTGCEVSNSIKKATDRSGKQITVPTAYWKAFLRRCKGNADWSACALWLDHNSTKYTINSSDLISVDALEEKIGIDLFVNLPKLIGNEAADAIEAKSPSSTVWPVK